MKSAIFFLAAAVALPLAAQSSGPSANGSFQFTTGDSLKTIEFHARTHQNGSSDGELTFTGAEVVPDQDVDGTGDESPGGPLDDLSITVEFDCLSISGNRAIMSGEISSASIDTLIGRRALFVVEDGGEGKNSAPDRFTWGLYRGQETGWVPSDAELTFDPGVGLSWLASDFEREDDIPVPSHPDTDISCVSFPLSAYALEGVAHGAGNIQVKP